MQNRIKHLLMVSFLSLLFSCGKDPGSSQAQLSQTIGGSGGGNFPPGDFLIATPPFVQIGQAVTLTWNTLSSVSVEIVGVGSNLPPRGSVQVFPFASTTYILRGISATGSVISRAALVEVGGPPINRIQYFWSTYNILKEGDAAVLNWQVNDCRSVFLEAVGRPEDSRTLFCGGTLEVRPKQSTQYILRAYDGNNNPIGTRSLTVVVTPAPLPVTTIDSFTSDANPIELGRSVTLSWLVRDATRVELSGVAVQNQPLNGSVTLTPNQTTTYTLSAYSQKGEVVTRQLTVEVRVKGPEFLQYSVDQSRLELGQESILRWSVANCLSTQIVGGRLNRAFECQGSVVIRPIQDATFEITATGSNGQVARRSVSVTVSPVPKIEFFYAERTSIKQGEPVKLSWKTENAKSVTLLWNYSSSPVPASGQTQLSVASTSSFVLRVESFSGRTLDAELKVEVKPLTTDDLLKKLQDQIGASPAG